MKTLILAAICCSLMFTPVTGSLVCVQPTQAYTVTLQQIGANVVANGSGAINLTGLAFNSSVINSPGILAEFGLIDTGPSAVVDIYNGFVGPLNFGSGGIFSPNTSSGDFVGIVGLTRIL